MIRDTRLAFSGESETRVGPRPVASHFAQQLAVEGCVRFLKLHPIDSVAHHEDV